jgi:hypothetical protein
MQNRPQASIERKRTYMREHQRDYRKDILRISYGNISL